jgi:hypothetical protein
MLGHHGKPLQDHFPQKVRKKAVNWFKLIPKVSRSVHSTSPREKVVTVTQLAKDSQALSHD